MASLRTNYKDDVLSGDRKYRMINNPDGTVSFVDVTDYTQEGDTFGATDINATNTAVNALQEANGDTDISGIGDGTNTGAIHTLNTQLTNYGKRVQLYNGSAGTEASLTLTQPLSNFREVELTLLTNNYFVVAEIRLTIPQFVGGTKISANYNNGTYRYQQMGYVDNTHVSLTASNAENHIISISGIM